MKILHFLKRIFVPHSKVCLKACPYSRQSRLRVSVFHDSCWQEKKFWPWMPPLLLLQGYWPFLSSFIKILRTLISSSTIRTLRMGLSLPFRRISGIDPFDIFTGSGVNLYHLSFFNKRGYLDFKAGFEDGGLCTAGCRISFCPGFRFHNFQIDKIRQGHTYGNAVEQQNRTNRIVLKKVCCISQLLF